MPRLSFLNQTNEFSIFRQRRQQLTVENVTRLQDNPLDMSTYIQPPDNTKPPTDHRHSSSSPVMPPRQHYDDNNNAESYERLLWRQQRTRARLRDRPPYAIHEQMWHRQQINQELLRRNITPLNLSTTTAGHGDLCACEILHPPRRVRPPRTYSIRVNHAPGGLPPGYRSQVHHHVFYRPSFVPDPQVHLSIGVDERDTNLLSSLNQFVRVLETTRRFMGSQRGATREVIERNTFPHKYKRIRRSSATDDDDMEKCTICLSHFEIEHEVRYDVIDSFF